MIFSSDGPYATPHAAPLGQTWTHLLNEDGSHAGHILRQIGTRLDGTSQSGAVPGAFYYPPPPPNHSGGHDMGDPLSADPAFQNKSKGRQLFVTDGWEPNYAGQRPGPAQIQTPSVYGDQTLGTGYGPGFGFLYHGARPPAAPYQNAYPAPAAPAPDGKDLPYPWDSLHAPAPSHESMPPRVFIPFNLTPSYWG